MFRLTILSLGLVAATWFVGVGALMAADPATPAAAPTTAPDDVKPFKPEEIEALVAPIALYPDSLVAQVLMASTYPLEIVQAQRWQAANKQLKDKALTDELEKKDWDPSVKSLIGFPQVLDMMSEKLEWTTKLGDAFIEDQKPVMDAVQKLRGKAQKEGNLKTTQEQKVVVEQVAQTQTVIVQGSAPPPTQVIKIEPTNPEVIYVPTYSPTVVYGSWPYPTYPPPAPYYPPGYVASNLVSFGVGMAVGAAWGYAWGGCNWGGGDVDVDIDRNTNINNNINRESYKNKQTQRNNTQAGNRQGTGNRTGTGNRQGSANGFQHDPSHRKGVSYRDNATAKNFDRPGTANASQARNDFRGRAETGRQDINRGGADQFRGSTPGGGNRATPSPGVGDRSAAGGGRTQAPSSARPSASPTGGGAFDGASRGGSAARSESSRGASSRSSSASRSSGGGGSSGGSRSGSSGGSRGGGGGGSRGGGGGGRR